MTLPLIALLVSCVALTLNIYLLATSTTPHERALLRQWVHSWTHIPRSPVRLSYDYTSTGGRRGVACGECSWSYDEKA